MVKQKNTEMVKQLKIWKQKLFYQIGFPCWCRCRCRQTLTDIWVCQVVEHQQCAHRLLDRHTILTSSTMIWVTILIIVLHRESWEGFFCFKIFDISVVSVLLFGSSCFLRADDGLPVEPGVVELNKYHDWRWGGDYAENMMMIVMDRDP